MSFKEAFEAIPNSLREIFIKRFMVSAATLVVGVIVWLVAGFSFGFPFLAMFLFFLVTGCGMFYYCITGNYVIVNGVCKNIEYIPVKGKVKCIYIYTDEGNGVIKIPPKRNAKKLSKGDSVVLYIPAKAITVKKDGVFELQEYYCLDLVSKTEKIQE